MVLKCTNNWWDRSCSYTLNLVWSYEGNNGGCLRLGCWQQPIQQCLGMLFGPWFGITVPSRATLPKQRALAEPGETHFAVMQLVMPNRKVKLLQTLQGHMCTICRWFVATPGGSAKVCPWHCARQSRLWKGKCWLLCIFCAWTVNLTLLENVSPLVSAGIDVGTVLP